MYDSINDFDVLAKNSRNITAILKTELPSVIDRNTVKNLNKAIFYGIELKEFDILPGLKAEDPTADIADFGKKYPAVVFVRLKALRITKAVIAVSFLKLGISAIAFKKLI